MTLSVSHVFFFQAEDGIRDFHVTGVQTCALPILPGVWLHPQRTGADTSQGNCGGGRIGAAFFIPSGRQPEAPGQNNAPAEHRSEERRVGKEGRTRWSPEGRRKRTGRQEVYSDGDR